MNGIDAFYYINYISKQLFSTYKDNNLCENYAWFLLEKIYNKTKTELIIAKTLELTPQQNKQLTEWIDDLTIKKMPIQYLLGSVPFNNLDILVESPVLIPRPETEEWCINLITQLKKLKNQKLHILDLATGSGCIALAFAYHFPQLHVIATDISPQALQLAQKNSLHSNIKNITFIQSDLFNKIPLSQSFDMIVSNPPYIAQSERKDLDESVTKWEDEHALFAADNGLAIIKKIIDHAPLYLKNNEEMKHLDIPQLVIEIGYQQGNLVKNYMINAGYNDVYIYKDLEKKDRVAVGRIDNVANSNTTE